MKDLKHRMIENMKLRGLASGTQARYLEAIKALAKHYNRPPQATVGTVVDNSGKQYRTLGKRPLAYHRHCIF